MEVRRTFVIFWFKILIMITEYLSQIWTVTCLRSQNSSEWQHTRRDRKLLVKSASEWRMEPGLQPRSPDDQIGRGQREAEKW